MHHQDDVIINQDLGVLVSTKKPIRQHQTHFELTIVKKWNIPVYRTLVNYRTGEYASTVYLPDLFVNCQMNMGWK